MTEHHPQERHTVVPDPILMGFIDSVDRDIAYIAAESPIARVYALPNRGQPPFQYRGTLVRIEHFVRAPDGTFRKSTDPIPFEVEFEHDYCRSIDPLLQFRVLRTSPSLVLPNASAGVCCLGNQFRPATTLVSILDRFYRLASGRLAATDDPFDLEAAEFFLSHRDEIRALQAPPLWRRPFAGSVRVTSDAPAPAAVGETCA